MRNEMAWCGYSRSCFLARAQKHTVRRAEFSDDCLGEALDTSNVLPVSIRVLKAQRDNTWCWNGVCGVCDCAGGWRGGRRNPRATGQSFPLGWADCKPFSARSPLSGVGRTVRPHELWYRRTNWLLQNRLMTSDLFAFWCGRLMCACFVNGKVCRYAYWRLPAIFSLILRPARLGRGGGKRRGEVATAALCYARAQVRLSSCFCVWDPRRRLSTARLSGFFVATFAHRSEWHLAERLVWGCFATHPESLTFMGDYVWYT